MASDLVLLGNGFELRARPLTDILTINGDASDSITLNGGGWSNSGTQTIDGNLVNVYTNGDATLHIDTDLNILIG